jgi:hypothetical protein
MNDCHFSYKQKFVIKKTLILAGTALILHKKIVGKCFHDRSFSLPLDSSYITLENFGLLEDSFHHIIAGYVCV